MHPITVEIPRKAFLPRYRHLLEPNEFDIEFLWGGRDSGKTGHIARQLLIDCMSSDYFRCILIKKTFESIRDAQWQTLKDVATDWGIDHLFEFKTAPLEVKCKINGNKFIARGCDKVEKIKSIANPSHAWFEEGNQLTADDYVVIDTTLRTNRGRVKKWFSFNPECEGDYKEFWLYKTFLSKHYEQGIFSFEDAISDRLPDGTLTTITYRSTWSNYRDNPYVTPDRQAKLETLKITNPFYYTVFTEGRWGMREVKNPFATAFNEAAHVSTAPVYDRTKELIVSMDFNIDPFAFTFWHTWRDKDGEHLHCFDEATIEGGSPEQFIEHMNNHYPQSIPFMKITGDPGGKNRQFSQRDNASLYVQIQRGLKLRTNQILVPSAPSHKNSRADVNYLLYHYPDFKIHPKCTNLIFDLKFVEVDATGGIVKTQRKDKSQRADHLDCFTGDTMVMTEHGQKRIDEIKIGEYVQTRRGLRKVIDAWDSIAPVYEATFTDGSSVKCTKDHRFFCPEKFYFLELNTIFKDKLKVWKRSFTKAESTESTQSKSTITSVASQADIPEVFTGKYGSIITEQYRRVCRYITKTAMLSTTILRTWNWFPKAITCDTTELSGCKTLKQNENSKQQDGKRQRNGTNHRRVLNGIGKMLKNVVSVKGNMEKEHVSFAKKHTTLNHFRQDSAQTTASPLGEGSSILTKGKRIAKNAEQNSQLPSTIIPGSVHANANQSATHTAIKVKELRYIGVERVYDITIEGKPEFYANGILVHNCQRYLVNTFFRDWILRHQKTVRR